MSVKMYGFRSCDMVRNALKWLAENKVEHEFFDYRKEDLDPKTVDDWFARAGWENVFNRNSTSYKEMPESDKTGIDAKRAKQLILENTNLIKRPLLDTGEAIVLGFKAESWARALKK